MTLREKLWLLISQATNAFIFNGDIDEPLCARRYREGTPEAIDKWLGQDHCKRVFNAQRLREDSRRLAKF